MEPMSRRARRGFTLIELLTVTGIMIVLGTLIIGALFAAQEAARTANCRNNLSQIHKLVIIYTQSYGQFLPAFWHERWIGELGLAGGKWRADIMYQMRKPEIKYMWEQYNLFVAKKLPTFPPSNGDSNWQNILARMALIRAGTAPYKKMANCDDVNPLCPMVWNNYQPPGNYLGPNNGESLLQRSSAPLIMCQSDTSQYRSDQGAMTSYMGLAKYGWWHRGDCPTTARYYEYHQLQEVTGVILAWVCKTHRDWMVNWQPTTAPKCPTCGASLVKEQVRKPGMGLLLAETEPGTWQYGGCG